MGHLHRLLGGLKDKTASLHVAAARHPRTTDHVRQCADCAAALRRQRQYLERLREAAIPAASDELTARLLVQTQQLAMAPAAAAPRTSPLRLAGLAGGVAVVAAGAVAAGAYLSAGEPPQYAASAGAASVSGGSGHIGAGDSPDRDDTAVTGAAGNGSEASEAESRLANLRSHGWACPDLKAMGFRIVSATTTVRGGHRAVELRLSDGRHIATILEQHSATTPAEGQDAAASPTVPAPLDSPVNPLTGHPARLDGFVAVGAAGGEAGGRLWIKAAAPWSAIYQASGTTFTYMSDLPADAADDAVAALAAAGLAADPGLVANARPDAGADSPGAESILDRVGRGLRKMARQFAN
ncbi:hypothetical protein ASG92_13375 [Arthrobacter sp. Soil736]|uniref:hypothetical protein n=1 Tax=Arthrobacter sp. Soil736 TaxID=1736395 RepID=UPI0006FAF632|nr:hypothetical protein [Arthrobacter sp. Soil736]KRE44646.1 hypothetical protein ASG92_13375 [Arthrobacter sp. Soil736]